MSLVDAALEYADLGFHVFPVAADCRSPIKVEGWFEHGVHDATSDKEEIGRRWSRFPTANIALATGLLSGVFALDVDVKAVDGAASLRHLVQQFGALPKSWRANTPSGGFHLFFRQPDRVFRNRVNFRPGLDIRTSGASVALAPSAKPHGRYIWERDPFIYPLFDAPEWLMDVIDPPLPPRLHRTPLRVDSLDRTARYVESAINGECGAIASMAPNSGRNLRLFQGAANLGELVGAGLLSQTTAEDALTRAADECGLSREDGPHAVRASIASGLRRGIAKPREVRR